MTLLNRFLTFLRHLFGPRKTIEQCQREAKGIRVVKKEKL